MQNVEIKLFNFAELEDEAKEKAREVFRSTWEYPWFEENMTSLRAFCKYFGGSVVDWSVGDIRDSFVKTDLTPSLFRGVKLKDIDRYYMPTGYCADSALWEDFYDIFKQSGDAFYAHQQAIEEFLIYVARDVEDYYSDQYIDEVIANREYQFLADGSVFYHDFRKVA